MTYETPQIDHDERRKFLKVLGITGAAAVGGDLAIGELREAADEPGPELAAMGEAIRNDLSGSLDAAVLETGLASIGTQIERIPELGAAGFPAADSTAYQELAEPSGPSTTRSRRSASSPARRNTCRRSRASTSSRRRGRSSGPKPWRGRFWTAGSPRRS